MNIFLIFQWLSERVRTDARPESQGINTSNGRAIGQDQETRTRKRRKIKRIGQRSKSSTLHMFLHSK